MNIWTKTLPLLAAVSLASGCVGTGDDTASGTEAGTADDTGSSMTAPTTAMTTSPDTGMDDTPDDSGTGDGTGDSGTGTGETDTGTSSTGPNLDPVFPDDAFEDYEQVDRVGFPGVNTALNLTGDKDMYNASDPAFDATGGPAGAPGFAAEIFEALNILHLGAADGMGTPDNTGLDDDLAAAGLDTCNPPAAMMDNCDDQGGPFVIPDTLNLVVEDGTPSTFPNGRQLGAAEMDPIIAVLLLDLSTMALDTFQDLSALGGTSLNPLTNDADFQTDFPYLAPAHE